MKWWGITFFLVGFFFYHGLVRDRESSQATFVGVTFTPNWLLKLDIIASCGVSWLTQFYSIDFSGNVTVPLANTGIYYGEDMNKQYHVVLKWAWAIFML